MAEQFSVEAIISAVDKGFSSTMNEALSNVYKLGQASSSTQGTVGNAGSSMVNTFKGVAGAMALVQVAGKAFDMVKDSVGSAVQRIDTLNNSTRTFSNMGFSAKETSAAMKGLQGSIKGLPTSLDGAVRGVQLIASATGDLGKSQKVWSAINDSVIGFGGSAAMAENATLQLSQALANGKIDAETWNSMMDSQMGPTLKAIAKEMGLTMGQLKEGLSSGEISVDQFQDALINLDKNGGGGLKSLHKIALDSTSGISTSMENMKTAIIRGTGEMIKGFDQFVTDMTGSGIAEHISNFGTMAENALKGVSNVLSEIGKNDFLKSLVVGLTAGAVAFTTIASTIVVVTKAWEAFQKVLAISTKLNVATAIIAIAAALIYFFTQTETGRALWQSFVTFLQTAWNSLKETATTVWQWITQTFQQPIAIIQAAWSTIVEFFSNLWTGIKTTATGVWTSFIEGMSPIIEAIKNLWTSLQEFFSLLWQGIVQIAMIAWQGFIAVITPIVAAVMAVWQVLSPFFSALWNDIVTIFSSVWSTITTVVQSAWTIITTVISTAINVVANIIRAVLAAIQGDWSGAWNALKSIASSVGNAIKTVVQALMNAVKAVFQNGWNTAKTVFSNGIKACVDVVKNFSRTMVSIGRDFVMGFVNGVKGAIGNAISAVENMASSAVNAAKKFLKIHSPSRVMRELGGYTAEGFALGITNSLSDVISAAQTMANSAIVMPSVDTTGLQSSLNNLGALQGGSYSGTLTMQDTSLQMQNNALLQQIANKSGDVYLDGNKWVGYTAGAYDDRLGQNISMKGRWS